MTTFSGKVTGVIYEYAPENMMSAADFEALLKAEKELAETKRQLAEIEHAYVDKDKQLQGARAECASAVNRAECNRRELEAARDECAKLQADNDWLRRFGAAPEASAQEIVRLQRELDATRDALEAVARSNNDWQKINAKLHVEIAKYGREKDEMRNQLEKENRMLRYERDGARQGHDICGAKAKELSAKCASLEQRCQMLRSAMFKVEETYESTAALHSIAYWAIVHDDELIKAGQQCGAS